MLRARTPKGAPDAALPEEEYTDGWISKGTLEAVLELPKKTQTALLNTVVRLGPLDELTGDHLLRVVLESAVSPGFREAGAKTLKRVADTLGRGGKDIDIDMLRTVAEAPAECHPALLLLLIHARRLGTMSKDMVVLEMLDQVRSPATRTMRGADVNRLAKVFALGPEFDDILLRFFGDERNDRLETLEREVEARMSRKAA